MSITQAVHKTTGSHGVITTTWRSALAKHWRAYRKRSAFNRTYLRVLVHQYRIGAA